MKAAFTPLSSDTGLPFSATTNPLLASWLRIDGRAQRVHIYSGKVELGQHILTAIAQIAAHELGLPFDQIIMEPARTGVSPDESITSGSLSIQHSGMTIRLVCREVRDLFLAAAAERFGVQPASLSICGGNFLSGDRTCGSYWELADSIDLNQAISARTDAADSDAPGVAASQTSIGLWDKVRGRYGFIHDMKPGNLVHGRMLRPPAIQARLLELDFSVLDDLDGIITTVQDGSLVGVVAAQEHIAEKAVARLAKAAVWEHGPCLPEPDQLVDWMRKQDCDTTHYSQDVDAPSGSRVARRYTADYFKPFIKHGSIGPSCAYASTGAKGQLDVWTHSQGIYNLRSDLAIVFDMPEDHIMVQHVPGAGCYGHNGADDVAFDAAFLSRHVPGKTVRVQWSRADELRWSPQGPAMSISVEADVDDLGRIIDWRQHVWSPGHSLRPGRAKTSTLLGSWYLDKPQPRIAAINAPIAAGGGAERNLIPSYDIPCSALASHRLLHMPIRTSSVRSLGAFGNVFAIEAMLDEIALDHQLDPIDYRLSMLSDSRAIELLHKVRAMSAWDLVRQKRSDDSEGATGWGIGYARYKNKGAYCAVVAKVAISHRVEVKQLFIATDVGEVINPDGVMQQIEGGAIQATSWALQESARFDDRALVDDTWETYPILRFSDVPDIQVEILPRPDAAPLGAGECSLGPTGAAIGNAIRDALGVRIPMMPMTFDQISRIIETTP